MPYFLQGTAAKFQNKYLSPKRNESLCPPNGICKNGPKSPELEITQISVGRRTDGNLQDVRTMDHDLATEETES